jgi:hypothetical protein
MLDRATAGLRHTLAARRESLYSAKYFGETRPDLNRRMCGQLCLPMDHSGRRGAAVARMTSRVPSTQFGNLLTDPSRLRA